MPSNHKRVTIAVVVVVMVVIVLYADHTRESNAQEAASLFEKLQRLFRSSSSRSRKPVIPSVQVATQVCGNRYGEIVTMLKSILLLTRAQLMLYIYVDEQNEKRMNDTLWYLKKKYPDNFTFKMMFVSYPGVVARNEFAEKTKPCSITRVFFPRLLPDVDSVIYLDTDMLFFRPIEELWSMFEKFNSSQVVAIPPDNPNKVNWYNTKAKHPSYGSAGLNTGVMLMNLTRLRAIGYTSIIVNLYKIWHSKIMWGEQDIHNIWLYYHPEKLYFIPCEWNYRDAHCLDGNACKGAEKNGIHILHGNGQRLVTPKKSPELLAVNNAFETYLSSENAKEDIAEAVKRNLGDLKKVTNCTNDFRRFFKNLKLP